MGIFGLIKRTKSGSEQPVSQQRVIEGEIERIGVSPHPIIDRGGDYVFRLVGDATTYKFNLTYARYDFIVLIRDEFALSMPGDSVKFTYDPTSDVGIIAFENLTLGNGKKPS